MASSFFTTEQSSTADASAGTIHRAESAPSRRLVALAPVFKPSSTGTSPSRDDLPKTGHRRTEVQPPSLFSRSRPQWKQWLVGAWQWLWDLDDLPDTPRSTVGLRKVKGEFTAAMWDLQSMRANQVRDQIEQGRSLRELWHLRAEVFKVISMHRGQIEAQLRLDALNSHFPVRASRRAEDGRSGRVTTW